MKLQAIEDLRTLGKQVEDLREQMKAAAKTAIKDGTKAIFDEYGDILHSFGWTQGAPAFNDGDPCYFSKDGLVLIAKTDIEVVDDEYGREDVIDASWGNEGSESFLYGREGRYKEAYDACRVIYEVIDDGLAEDIFGESAKVIFTPKGVDVEEYDYGY